MFFETLLWLWCFIFFSCWPDLLWNRFVICLFFLNRGLTLVLRTWSTFTGLSRTSIASIYDLLKRFPKKVKLNDYDYDYDHIIMIVNVMMVMVMVMMTVMVIIKLLL